MPTLLVISDNSLTTGLRSVLERALRDAQFPTLHVRIITHLSQGCVEKRGKTKMVAAPAKREEFLRRLQVEIARYKPQTILIQDWVTLEYITQKNFQKSGLGLTRGSVYFINNIPAIVIDSFKTKDGGSKLHAQPYFLWALRQDIKKAKRWYSGVETPDPNFSLRVCNSVSDVERLQKTAARSVLIATDTETAGGGRNAIITCAGYTCLTEQGECTTFVVPFVNPTRTDRLQWTDSEFACVLDLLRRVGKSTAPKVLQNGGYDATYYIRYGIPLDNWVLDTAVAWHSIWPELPKRVDFIASIGVDHYRYWKDEGKEDAKEDTKAGRLPTTQEGWDKYLRYNGLDCHYLIPCSLYLTRLLANIPWAMENYRQSMRQVLRPAMQMSYRGLRVNEKLQKALELHNTETAQMALADLRQMAADKNFNPSSDAQVAAIIYDVYKAEPIKKRGAKKAKTARPVDEKVLSLLQTQHPILERIIDTLWLYKKAQNNISKYGEYMCRYSNSGKAVWNGLQLLNGRWLYKLNPIGTDTGRYSSSASNLWIGTQIQNPPYEIRAMIEPDEGYVLWRADLSKADMWHTAFASEEPEMMRVVQEEAAGGLDVHCYHASRFYRKDYNEIYAGYKNKESWVVDSLHGVRQNAKRIVYGANYLMAGFTLFLTMGLQAVRATAEAMGYDTKTWNVKDYVNLCQQLINFYFSDMYPMLQPWLERKTNMVVNAGNLATCAGGKTRLFFGNPITDKAVQRKLAAFFGQGGTGATINKALDNIFYKGIDSRDCMVNWQLHDELGGQIRKDKLYLLQQVHDAMAVENTINGRTFTIPVDFEVGMGWGYRMTSWHEGITLDEIEEADAKWREKNPQLMRFMQ